MNKNFDIEKAIACVAYICKSFPSGSCRQIDIIKAMYVAERESICTTFNSMVGDAMMCYPKGPILKNIHDIMRGRSSAEYLSLWNKHFCETKNGKYKTISVRDESPDMSVLSPADEAFLNRGIGFVISCQGRSIVHESHKSTKFIEWVDARNKGQKLINIGVFLKDRRKDLSENDIRTIKERLA